MQLDVAIRNGTIVTAADTFRGEIGIAAGRIVSLGERVGAATREIDATDLLVMPGGVDAHCHIEEPPYLGATLADDFASATRAAACGGTTTLVPFANQLEGFSLTAAVADYHSKAAPKALIDYAFHILLRDAAAPSMLDEVPALMAAGHRSLKVFMSYPGYMLNDERILAVMACAQAHRGTVLVHAENGHCVQWLSDGLERQGRTELNCFAEASPAAVEREATHRAITLSQLTDARIVLVHVSSADALEQIDWARRRGLSVMAETCPQYLLDLAESHDPAGWEQAKNLCSPPARGGENATALWRGTQRGSFQLLSSDHCSYRFAGSDGKRSQGTVPHFRRVPPGLPGLETRLPVLYDTGVLAGRLSAQQFVALTSANPARIYGLYPRKGSLAPGADADIALWDTSSSRTITHAALHDACDYTPFEGRVVGAWPVMTLSRGELVWDRGWISSDYGRGRFLAQAAHG